MRTNQTLLFAAILCFFTAAAQAADTPPFPAVKVPAQKLFPGEKMRYAISYLGLTIGHAEAEVKALETYEGRPAYRIEVSVKSNPVIDLIYKVRDEHKTWIDAEKLRPLRYEKKIHEGRTQASEIQSFDYAALKARNLSPEGKVVKEADIPETVQDQLSCGYVFRMREIKPETTESLPVYADGKIWKLDVVLKDQELLKIPGIGIFSALEAEPEIAFQGIFVKKGKIRGWLSLDERRIPLKMETAVPVLGKVKAELESYQPGEG